MKHLKFSPENSQEFVDAAVAATTESGTRTEERVVWPQFRDAVFAALYRSDAMRLCEGKCDKLGSWCGTIDAILQRMRETDRDKADKADYPAAIIWENLSEDVSQERQRTDCAKPSEPNEAHLI